MNQQSDQGRPQHRSWCLPPLILGLVAVLIVTGTYAAGRVPTVADTQAARFLPADGSVASELVEVTRDSSTSRTSQVTESALINGGVSILSVDTALGFKAFATVSSAEAARLRTWRTVSTPLGTAYTRQLTRVYRVNAAVELLGESGPGTAYVYHPAVVELPADVQPGRGWTGVGLAGDKLRYRAALSADADPAGCLVVSGRLSYLTLDGTTTRTVNRQRTWCPGQGLVAAIDADDDGQRATSRISRGAPLPINTLTPAISWTDPQNWARTRADVQSIDPTYGQQDMVGSPMPLDPVRTASGLVVRPLVNMQDLVAFALSPNGTLLSRWRAHMPGTVLTLSAFGDVIVVTTADRQLLGYSATGVRLWQHQLAEVAPTSPARLTDSSAVLVDLAGQVRAFNLVSGSTIWQASIGADVNRSPVVGGGLVVIMDRAGTTTGLDAATGQSRWTQDLLGNRAEFIGGTLVVLQDRTAHGLDPATGRNIWLRAYHGPPTELAAFGDRLLLATTSETLLLDSQGRITTRLPPALGVTLTTGHAICFGRESAELIDPRGTVLASWQLPPLTPALQDRRAVALPAGVLLVGSEWKHDVWAARR